MDISLSYGNQDEIVLTPVKISEGENGNEYKLTDNTDKEYVRLRLYNNKLTVLNKDSTITEDDDSLDLKLDELVLEIIESIQKGTEDNEVDNWNLENPYDPEKIRVDTKPFSLRLISDMIDSGDIDLTPDFQRKFVWDSVRKSQLIESILLRIPLPMFYFYQDLEGRITVVDGLQRLTTIKDFIDGKFSLRGLEYLSSNCEGKFYTHTDSLKAIDAKYFRWFNMTQITVNVIDPQSPTNVKFDIFRRINTGGKPLNNQEIRNCLASKTLRDTLRAMAEMPEFKAATEASVKDVRMEAQEMALRFIYFYRAYKIDSTLSIYNGNMEYALDTLTDELTRAKKEDLTAYISLFSNAMKNAKLLFGKYAFRKVKEEHLQPGAYKQLINKALFVSWAVLLADLNIDLDNSSLNNSLSLPLAQRITGDNLLFYYLSYGTNGKVNLQYAFKSALTILIEKGFL